MSSTGTTVAATLGSLGGAGALALLDRLLIRRKTNAEADSITAVASKTASEVFRELVKELRDEMARREHDCAREIARLKTEIDVLRVQIQIVENRQE